MDHRLLREMARVEARVVHFKDVILPAKALEKELLATEVDMLFDQTEKAKREKYQAERMYRDAMTQLQSKDQQLQSVTEDRELYKKKLSITEELYKNQQAEMKHLKQQLATKVQPLPLESDGQEKSSLSLPTTPTRLTILKDEYRRDMSSAYDLIMDKEDKLKIVREKNKDLVKRNHLLRKKLGEAEAYKKKSQAVANASIAMSMQFLMETTEPEEFKTIDCVSIMNEFVNGTTEACKTSAEASTRNIKRAANWTADDSDEKPKWNGAKKQRYEPK